MSKKDTKVELLKTMRGPKVGEEAALKIIKVKTTEPAPITFVFEGTPTALDMDLFEIPVSCYPLRVGDRLLVFPLVGKDSDGMRWAAVEKISGGITIATMQSATSLKVTGVGKTYGAADLIIPPYFVVSDENDETFLKKEAVRPLKAGDQVSIAPTLVGTKIKYVILEKY